jgi:hypothetical protein
LAFAFGFVVVGGCVVVPPSCALALRFSNRIFEADILYVNVDDIRGREFSRK